MNGHRHYNTPESSGPSGLLGVLLAPFVLWKDIGREVSLWYQLLFGPLPKQNSRYSQHRGRTPWRTPLMPVPKIQGTTTVLPEDPLERYLHERLGAPRQYPHIRDIMRNKSTEMKDTRCSCHAEKFNNVHLSNCPLYRQMSDPNKRHVKDTAERPTSQGMMLAIDKHICYNCGETLYRDYDDPKDAEGEALNCRACSKTYYNKF